MKKKILIASLAIALLIGVVGAGLLTYYGKIQTTATVEQAVVLDGKPYTEPVTHEFTAYGGYCVCKPHYLKNRGLEEVTVQVEHKVNGAINDPATTGIEILLLEPIYEEHNTNGADVEATIVKEWSCCTTSWIVDILSVNEPHGVYGIGLAISFDRITPTFQVWYAEHGPAHDDTNMGWYYQEYPWGSNLVVPIDEVDGITINAKDPTEKHFEIYIKCWKLGGCGVEYYWTMQLRTNLITWLAPYDWGENASEFLENHTGIPIEEIVLAPGERLDFGICYSFNPKITPGTYMIVTTFS